MKNTDYDQPMVPLSASEEKKMRTLPPPFQPSLNLMVGTQQIQSFQTSGTTGMFLSREADYLTQS
jgi:hypothetical protein